MVNKAEQTPEGANPGHGATTLNTSAWDDPVLNEDRYCAPGEAENRIAERFELVADRASCESMASNEWRLRTQPWPVLSAAQWALDC